MFVYISSLFIFIAEDYSTVSIYYNSSYHWWAFLWIKLNKIADEYLIKCVCVCVCSVAPDSLQPHRLQPARVLCPWNFPGENTGVGCHFLLWGSRTSGSNPSLLRLLHWQADSLPLHHRITCYQKLRNTFSSSVPIQQQSFENAFLFFYSNT